MSKLFSDSFGSNLYDWNGSWSRIYADEFTRVMLIVVVDMAVAFWELWGGLLDEVGLIHEKGERGLFWASGMVVEDSVDEI